MKILSILICTITGRDDQFDYIYKRLCEQRTNLFMKNEIEILSLKDDCTMTVGEKRNKLVALAKGRHICFIDDDDDIPQYYLKEITKILKDRPGIYCIGFLGIKTTNGLNLVTFSHCPYSKDIGFKDGKFGNPINHLNPVRRDIAIKHKFPHINNGEDQEWAKKINREFRTDRDMDRAPENYGFINTIMYHYRYNTTTTVARKDEQQ